MRSRSDPGVRAPAASRGTGDFACAVAGVATVWWGIVFVCGIYWAVTLRSREEGNFWAALHDFCTGFTICVIAVAGIFFEVKALPRNLVRLGWVVLRPGLAQLGFVLAYICVGGLLSAPLEGSSCSGGAPQPGRQITSVAGIAICIAGWLLAGARLVLAVIIPRHVALLAASGGASSANAGTDDCESRTPRRWSEAVATHTALGVAKNASASTGSRSSQEEATFRGRSEAATQLLEPERGRTNVPGSLHPDVPMWNPASGSGTASDASGR